MGNSSGWRVKVLESVPAVGVYITIIHLLKGNWTETFRALVIQTLTCFAVGGVAVWIYHPIKSILYAGLTNTLITTILGIYALKVNKV